MKDVKDSAHYAAHVAGMVHTRSAKGWAQQAASRSAEAIDQAEWLGVKLLRWAFERIFVDFQAFSWSFHDFHGPSMDFKAYNASDLPCLKALGRLLKLREGAFQRRFWNKMNKKSLRLRNALKEIKRIEAWTSSCVLVAPSWPPSRRRDFL